MKDSDSVSELKTAPVRVVDAAAEQADSGPDATAATRHAVVEQPPGVLQRVLLTTDGSIGRILEVFADEPIEAVKLEQWSVPAGEENPALALAVGEEVLRRRVLLRGAQSGRNFIYADALIAIRRVHPTLRSGLLDTSVPIGKLLTLVRAETFRELLSSGKEPAGTCARHFGIEEHDEVFVRDYRIVNGGEPIMLITEKFPTNWFLTGAIE